MLPFLTKYNTYNLLFIGLLRIINIMHIMPIIGGLSMKKMKKVLAGVLTVILSVSLATPALAYTAPDKVKVGLEYAYKAVDRVPIDSKDIEIGVEYNSEFYGEADFFSSRGFAVTVATGNTVDAVEYYQDFYDALDACDNIKSRWGYNAVPVYTARKSWGVYVCDLSATQADAAVGTLGGQKISSSNVMVLLDGNTVVMAFNGVNPQISSLEGNITVGARRYRGTIEVIKSSSNKLTAVNVLKLDEYLYGVVPSEMPPSWHSEALKAQAIASRSYALSRMDRHQAEGYHFCDGTHCQVYVGASREQPSTTGAVNTTHNMVATYDDKPINAVYFSSSGGATDNSENVWANPVAYLKTVPEINEQGISTWTRTYSAAQMETILKAKGIDVGSLKNIEITEVGPYGRVQKLTVTGSRGTATITGEDTRTLFSGTSEGGLSGRMYTINGNGGVDITLPNMSTTSDGGVYIMSGTKIAKENISDLYVLSGQGNKVSADIVSTLYGISISNTISKLSVDKQGMGVPQVSSAKNITFAPSGDTVGVFVFTGKGAGHGVGMSQYGAKGMAEQGYTYDEILKYYYTGISLD